VLLELGGDHGLREAAAGWADRVGVVCADQPDCDAPVDGILVRPDGYVAWLAPEGAGTEGLTDALTRWFGPAT
jgi:hypothetical protein